MLNVFILLLISSSCLLNCYLESLLAFRGLLHRMPFMRSWFWRSFGIIATIPASLMCGKLPAWTAGGCLRIGWRVPQTYELVGLHFAVPELIWQTSWEFMATMVNMDLSQVMAQHGKVIAHWIGFLVRAVAMWSEK